MHNFEDVHGPECLVTKPTRITDTTNHFHSCFLLSAGVTSHDSLKWRACSQAILWPAKIDQSTGHAKW